MKWPNSQIAELKNLEKQKITSGQIAKRLGVPKGQVIIMRRRLKRDRARATEPQMHIEAPSPKPIRKPDGAVDIKSKDVELKSATETTAGDSEPIKTWTPERIEILTTLWGEGMPAGEIGEEIGVSKNTVIGKAYRLGLERRPSPIRTKPKSVDITNPFPPTDKPQEPTGCRWIDGDIQSDAWRYCQAEQKQDSAYCHHHHERCYRRVDLSRRTDLAETGQKVAQ